MNTIKYLWQLPQVLLALILIKLFKLNYNTTINNVPIYSGNIFWGVSLGMYILLGDVYYDKARGDPCAPDHEYGHTRQSLYLGPLYLLVIGIPSATMNLMSTYSLLHGSGKFYRNYYNRWPENWADELGGVKHNTDGTRSIF